jgi:hypothetical protein
MTIIADRPAAPPIPETRADTYIASRAQLGVRVFTPALAGAVPVPGVTWAGTHNVTLTVRCDEHVETWVEYLRDQRALVIDEPAEDGPHYTAVVVWDGWTVTITCPDPAAAAHAALRDAVAVSMAARGATVSDTVGAVAA